MKPGAPESSRPGLLKRLARRPVRDWSLRLRLSVFLALFICLAWACAAFFAWRESRSYIDEFFDTQQMLFAKRLLAADLGSMTARLPKTKKILKGSPKEARGKQDKDALGFAVFNGKGEVLLTDGEKGDRFIFDGWTRGFSLTVIERSDEPWRMVWLVSPDGERIVAVGQELEYRRDMALDMLARQLLPWLLLFPAMLAGLLWMLSRELAPLQEVARDVALRSPEDTGPLSPRRTPAEIKPLVAALNSLFGRVNALLGRERAFISDAAHELRTPLAGLRVQAEVAVLAEDDAAARDHALGLLLAGIDRSNRLIEQLLILSRLDALPEPGSDAGPGGAFSRETARPGTEIWASLLAPLLPEYKAAAQSRNINITAPTCPPPVKTPEESPLLVILLRNLLDNAVKYTPTGGWITIEIDGSGLRIRNSGSGLSEAHMQRLGERFFRPPGQPESGSGLGLSIAGRIACLHGLRLAFLNGPDDPGFTVEVLYSGSSQPGKRKERQE